MARYGKETPLSPKRTILLAREHFGPDGDLGLPIVRESWNEVSFEGGGGGVTVSAMPKPARLEVTDVTITSREYDRWAERYLAALPNVPGPAPAPVRWVRGLLRRLGGR